MGASLQICEGADLIKTLAVNDHIQSDHYRLLELQLRFGRSKADAKLCEIQKDLAVQLAKVHVLLARGDLAAVQGAATKILDLATHVGLETLAVVAADIVQVTSGRDGTALAAVAARLSRVGEHALIAAKDVGNRTI